MFDYIIYWTKWFLGRPLGLGTTGGITGASSVLTLFKTLGDHAAPIGVVLGVIATGYSIYLNAQRRRDERVKHAIEVEILRRKLRENGN